MLKAYRTELAPTLRQEQKIRRALGIVRYLYNSYIDRNRRLWHMYSRGQLDSSQQRFLTAYDYDKYVNRVLKEKQPWIGECGSKARKKALMNAEAAFRRFFRGQGGFPRYKKRCRQGVKLYFPRSNPKDWRVEEGRVMIPTLGLVRLKERDYLPRGQRVLSGTVSRVADRYFVSLVVEIEEDSPLNRDREIGRKPLGAPLSLSLGGADFAATPVRRYPGPPGQERLSRLEGRLARAIRSLRRKRRCLKAGQEEGANVDKARLQVQRLALRLACIREDYENKVVHELVRERPAAIRIEAGGEAAGYYRFLRKLGRKAEVLGIELC